MTQATQQVEATTAAFNYTKGAYEISVEAVTGKYYPTLLRDGEIVWSGSLTADLQVAKGAAIRQYHLSAKDLVASDRVVMVDPELLLSHPKNSIVYKDDEDTAKLHSQLDTEEGDPYISVYIVLEDGTIISGNRRNYVVTELINPSYREKYGKPKISEVPVLVRHYKNESDEIEALVLENQYRENKSNEARLAEAAILLQVEAIRARERKAKAKAAGEVIEEGEKGRSIRLVAERTGFKQTDLQNQLGVTSFINDNVKDPKLSKLWRELRDLSTHAAVELRKIWERDRVRDELTDEHFVLACEAILGAGKGKLKASNAITQAKRAIAEKKRKAEEAKKSKGSPATPVASTASSNGSSSGATSTPIDVAVDGVEAVEDGQTPDETNSLLESETEGMKPESKERWVSASEEQREIWRKARRARDVLGDNPSNNRLSPRAELIDRCLQVIESDEFDFDPFADLTNPQNVPCKSFYTIEDDFLKKNDQGEYVNPIKGNVYANILWSKQWDCVHALSHWIDKGEVESMFIVSQASILNLASCQEVIKRHGMAIASWSGRLEFEAGEILIHDCYFPKEGEPKKVSQGNQRYDTVVLFYTKNPDQKIAFDSAFSSVALVSFQKEMLATSAMEASEYIKIPSWIGGVCNWQDCKLRIEMDDDGVWTTFIALPNRDEIESESFASDTEAKSFLLGLALMETTQL